MAPFLVRNHFDICNRCLKMALAIVYLSLAFAALFLPNLGQCKNGDAQSDEDRDKLIASYDAEYGPHRPLQAPLPPVNIEKEIRRQNKNWVAGKNKLPDDVQKLFGAKYVPVPPPPPPPPPPSPGVPPAPVSFGPAPVIVRLPPRRGGGTTRIATADKDFSTTTQTFPAFYDLRTEYPQCKSITSIKSQRGCNGCYAFAASGVMSDRHCIYNYAKTGQIYISTFNILSCIPPDGCNGGIEWDALAYWGKKGFVSGSAAADGVTEPPGCLPLPNDPTRAINGCPTKCSNQQYSKSFDQDKTFGGASGVKWFPNIPWIQDQIYNFGPVIAFFSVYEDFMYNYTSGVYDYVGGNKLGPHTVKLIGWGTQGGVDYWLAVNSWGLQWGDKGIFKVRRGVNTCQIEARVSWVVPKEAMP